MKPLFKKKTKETSVEKAPTTVVEQAPVSDNTERSEERR